ncbi:MAG: DUF7009 family protein [Candidatus Cyclobacteriaceae bacterium M2_1C_046]
MKLRIKGSTIRLRLSEPEVSKVIDGLTVQETVYFGRENIFKYSVIPDECDKICADYTKNTIKISIPKDKIKEWGQDDEKVGFDHTEKFAEGTSLYILIEKDYKCLTDRDEDESDLFDNPQEKHNC